MYEIRRNKRAYQKNLRRPCSSNSTRELYKTTLFKTYKVLMYFLYNNYNNVFHKKMQDVIYTISKILAILYC